MTCVGAVANLAMAEFIVRTLAVTNAATLAALILAICLARPRLPQVAG